jgi:hypothetical protein
MGSSPGGGSGKQPINQGPPISQLYPAQGAPTYTQFINGSDYQTGLTPEMLAGIASSGASPAPLQMAAPPPAAAATAGGAVPGGAGFGGAGLGGAVPGAGSPDRQKLAALMMAMQQSPEQGYNTPHRGGRGGGGDYGGGRSSSSFGGRAAGGRGAY